MAEELTAQQIDDLWASASLNSENRARAQSLSMSYSGFIRYWREIVEGEAGSAKSPNAELELIRSTIERLAHRRDELNLYVIKAEDEYDRIMRKLDYEQTRG